MESWIKLHRKIREWEWYTDPVVPRVFVHLLLSANWKDKKWQHTTIKTGELITSLANLSKELDLSVQRVRTALDKLQSTGVINTQATNKYTRIRVLNYCQYQDDEHQKGTKYNTQLANNQHSDNKKSTTTKEYKELKNNRQEEIYINNNSSCRRIINHYEQNKGEAHERINPNTEKPIYGTIIY